MKKNVIKEKRKIAIEEYIHRKVIKKKRMKSDKNNIMIAVVSVTTLFESSDILNKCLIQVKKK
jgi:hypothetical protein